MLGQGGSGKTYLAKRLQHRYGIPVIHIDRIWIRHGGHLATREDARESVRRKLYRDVARLVDQPDWVSEGFYSRVQSVISEKADLVIHLPRPLAVRVFNHLWRTIRQTNRHKEISWRKDVAHSITLIKKSRAQRRKLEEVLREVTHKTVHLRTRREVRAFLNALPDDIDELRRRYQQNG